MPHPTQFWLQLYRAFDPSEVLAGERSRTLYCPREHSPFDDMVMVLRKEEQPTKPPVAFFTGHRGSGKSSLLFKLRDHFNEDYFVVYVNITHNLDSPKANLIDLLLLLGTTIFQAAVQEGYAINKELLQDLGEAVYAITYNDKETVRDQSLNLVELAQKLLIVTAGMAGSSVGKMLADGMGKIFKISSGVTEEILRTRPVEPQIPNILRRINLIIAEVEDVIGKPLLVIVDDLDKIQRQEQANELFINSTALQSPLCRIIYTVPMLVYTSLAFGEVETSAECYFLPNIRLYHRTNQETRYEKGYAELREVVTKRLLTVGLTEEKLFEKDTLDLLIFKSGGVLRWLIRLVEDACRYAEQKGLDSITMQAAQTAVDKLLAEYTRRLTIENTAELKRVHEAKKPSQNKECADLLHALLIVAYQNSRTWFDAHPLIWDELV